MKVHNIFKSPKLVLNYLMNKRVFNCLNDETFLKIKYKNIMGKKLNLKNPQTFNEKLQWLKIYDRKPIYTKMVDKYEAKIYAKNIIGNEYIIPTLGIYNSFDEIDFEKLPKQFVMKPTHTSGNVYICLDKNDIDYKKLRKLTKKWLRINYYWMHREWPYKNVKPRIIIEEYIGDLSRDNVKDYKFFVFNGNFAYSFVCSERKTNLKFTFFDKNGEFLDITQDNCPNDKKISKPIKYQEMVELSKKLAKDAIQLRIDFYEVNSKIYFGELTFFDSAGFGKFDPEEWDYKIGEMLELPMNRK